MGSLRQIGAGFLLGVISIAAVIGGFALSLAEGGAIAAPSLTVPPSAMVTVYSTIPLLTDTPQAIVSDTPVSTSTLPASLTPPPPPASCLPPAGWQAIQIQGYETLASLAQKYQTAADAIKQGNCLFSDQLIIGSYLYVPPRPTATLIPCGAPYGWVNYYVVPGDTLFSISVRYRVTVTDLQRANCLGSSTFIAVGKPIRVPNVPTSTSSVKTPTWTASPTLEVASPTLEVASPTLEVASPTLTLIPPSVTASLVPTTEVPSPTTTTQPSPTLTPEPSVTASPTTPAPSG
jgi:LysM repeat protein